MGEKHLVLIGLMGAGKTTVGRQCARQLRREFVDTDDVVVALARMPVEDIFRTGGEPSFRDLERKAVAVLRPRDENRVAQLLVGERGMRP